MNYKNLSSLLWDKFLEHIKTARSKAKINFKVCNAILISQLCFTGCSTLNTDFPEVQASLHSGQLIQNTSIYQTAQKKYKADYGTLIVQEKRTKEGSRNISLPVIRIHSSSHTPKEPVFILSGGPGASNLNWTPPDYILSNHDVVIVGYRGADGSSVLECPEVESALTAKNAILSLESLQLIGKAWTKCSQRLTKSGVDLNGYTMLDVIEDIEVVRNYLGYNKINLLSRSYGTRVAYLYGLKHEQKIHRSVMIGVTPPGHFGWEPTMIDQQLEHYAKLWQESNKNLASSSDLINTIKNVNNNMPASWLLLPIDADKVKLGAFFALYHRDGAAKVFDMYIKAEQGDYSGLALMTLAYNYFLPSSVIWGDFISKVSSADFDENRNYIQDMSSESSIMGSPFGKLANGSLQLGEWPIQKLPKKYRTPQNSSVETLIISGSIDFSTPAENATNDLLPFLKNGNQVILSELGHTKDILYVAPKLTERLLTTFYSTGNVDKSSNKYIPMDFDVRFGWPEMMKSALASLIGILIFI